MYIFNYAKIIDLNALANSFKELTRNTF